MNWTQVIDPFNNLGLSALVAAVPVIFIFWALIIKKMKGYFVLTEKETITFYFNSEMI